MKKIVITLVIFLTVALAYSQVSISPYVQLPERVDKDTISAELGDVVMAVDSVLYFYDGIQWQSLSVNVNYNTSCCPIVKYYDFLGEPDQTLFETVFGHASYNYIGTLYCPVQDKAWSFTYLSGIPENNWKWIALKD